ncbi:DUF2083 domain-containing protein [Gluconacetobacter aggeris]|uniref:DUF2083 domain-containing protein n=1 Tax=Gluconacetobacter aggeris TaxID=1286186 RepID=A0A7W4IQX6_9PROT|nr:helix-turn-helix transcriptional regulator [Gluconacetobacter aggeris]MBB2167436.1 DUF2083 domain-containing protein [Gluconacetobacter aggeris]
MATAGEKIFAGSRIRDLRARNGQSQQGVATALGLSASYLNQIENDQRPLTPGILLKLCTLFGVEPTWFSDSGDIQRMQVLREILGDPLFSAMPSPRQVQEAVRGAPWLCDQFVTLYRAFRALQEERGQAGAAAPAPQPGTGSYDAVGDWVQAERNYFDEIDRAAEALYESARLEEGGPAEMLGRYLRDRHDIRIVTDAALDSQGVMWRFDRRARRLAVTGGVPPESTAFWLAQVIGRLDYGQVLARPVRRSGLGSADARALATVGMSNYFAGALLLPYERFRRAARQTRHDLDLLQRQFGVSFEQVCHRLSTMQRPGAEGIPFYFIKTDIAGNVLKSYSATRFSRARFGGLCAQWNVFECFSAPGKLHVQMSRTTDDAVYISVARTVGHSPVSYFDRPRLVAIVLGCAVSHAPELVYSAGLDLRDDRMVIPIGPGCRACIRTDCRHRAIPATGFGIDAGSEERGVVPYHMVAP